LPRPCAWSRGRPWRSDLWSRRFRGPLHLPSDTTGRLNVFGGGLGRYPLVSIERSAYAPAISDLEPDCGHLPMWHMHGGCRAKNCRCARRRGRLRGRRRVITSNYRALDRFFRETRHVWRKWLSRRSSAGYVDWQQLLDLLQRFPLPRPRIVHRARDVRSPPRPCRRDRSREGSRVSTRRARRDRRSSRIRPPPR
jgi:hypothetical protein